MPERTAAAEAALAQVLAHCGGAPAAAVDHLARAIASAPARPEPFAVLFPTDGAICWIIDPACAGPGLPVELLEAAWGIRRG